MKLATFVLATLCAGCATSYRPPTAQQPHAVVKFRRVYPVRAGESLRENLLIDGHGAFNRVAPAQTAAAPHTDGILVHPQPATLSAESTFFHTEVRTFTESYSVQVPYSTMETYSCGFGRTHSMCTRSATHYRSEMRTRLVTRPVEVVDAACTAARSLAPAVNGVYLLELDFQGSGVCRLSCYEQVPADDGTFENRRCPVPIAQH
jgi:hypothetical protein